MLEAIKKATAHIQKSITRSSPDYGIILGTGLGALADEIQNPEILNYEDIPGFAVSTVESHKGKLIFGTLGGKNVVAMQGRLHFYEGYPLDKVVFPVRVMKMLGIKALLISNACGSLNPEIKTCDLMIINDHINLIPSNPLFGKNIDELGPRFPDMSMPYDSGMIKLANKLAKEEGINIHNGVYVSVPGPNLETKAEYKYLRIIGGDVVGMSTVPEVIAARHMNLPCFAVSVITDEGFHKDLEPVSLQDVIYAAGKAEPELTKLFVKLINAL